MFDHLRQEPQKMLGMSLSRLLWNMVGITLTAIIFIITTFKYVEARDYSVPFPYMIDGLDELKRFISKKERQLPVTLQEFELGHTLKVVGVFQSTGSGIEGINAYVYTCETNGCELFLFLRTLESKVTIELAYETKEMILKSHKGTVICRTPFLYLAVVK